MGSVESRRQKQDWIKAAIAACFKEKVNVVKSALIAEFSLKNYTSERTAIEILRAMERVGEIVIMGDVIVKGEQWN